MVSSVLSPEKIVGRQNTNKAAAQNFISGGSVVGAANKIVGFQRAGVQPTPSAVGNIISTISTNINNNVNNTVNKTIQGFSADYQRRVKEFDINKITTNVTNTVNKTIQGFSADYQRRVKQVDNAKPIGILGKFLNVYKTSLGFINFFGNKRNIDKVRNNLEALKKSFTESFEVAKLIRQVIIKIVKQLSNLPVASPSGGGGLNLDVDIPGGPLRKTAPRGLQRMMGGGKGKMLALGAGALGLGVAGGAAVNALSDSPQDQAKAAETSPDIPGDVVDKFSSIVDRFANVVSKLFNMKNEKSKGSAGSAGGGGGTKPSAAPGATPGGPAPNLSSSGSEGVIDYAKQKGFSEQFTAGLLTQVSHESGGNPFAYNPDDVGKPSYGSFQFRAERGDSMIKYLESNGIPNAKPIFTNSKDPRRNDKELQKKALSLQIKYFTEDEKDQATAGLRAAQKSTSIEEVHRAFAASERYDGYDNPNSERYRARLADTKTSYKDLNKSGKMRGTSTSPTPVAKPGVGGPDSDLPDFMLPLEKRKQYQNLATNVSQPPPSQQQQQPVVMPINLGGGGQQQSGGGSGGGGGGGSQGSGPSVPFLPAGNPDNFLVLYSRMVYNIVDG